MTDGKKTVLVVDDEPDTVAFLTTLLEDNGFATISAGDSKPKIRAQVWLARRGLYSFVTMSTP